MSNLLKSEKANQTTSQGKVYRSSVIPARYVGPAIVWLLVGALAALWLIVGPPDGQWSLFIGQLAGAEAVLLMSIAIVLVTALSSVEVLFDGIDRAAIWHRRLSIIGMLLLLPHIYLSLHFAIMYYLSLARGENPNSVGRALANIATLGLLVLVIWSIIPRWRAMLPWLRRQPVNTPPPLANFVVVRWVVTGFRFIFGGYERWRWLHRLTGLFLAAGIVHGLLNATVFGSPLLRWTYIAIAAAGLVAYVYRETIALFFRPLHDYQVAAVTSVGPGVTDLALTPVGLPMHFRAGQFAMLYLESKFGWRRHPFTISSSPDEEVLHFTIKALGDDTGEVQQIVQVGMPAMVCGPRGRFDWTRGTDHQVWIAGGIGVTPFLSWLRSLDHQPLPSQVDFFYSTDGSALFADEIITIAASHPELHVHIHNSRTDGHLTADQILAGNTSDPCELSVFLCGPAGMVRTLVSSSRRAGVVSKNIYHEYFDWR